MAPFVAFPIAQLPRTSSLHTLDCAVLPTWATQVPPATRALLSNALPGLPSLSLSPHAASSRSARIALRLSSHPARFAGHPVSSSALLQDGLRPGLLVFQHSTRHAGPHPSGHKGIALTIAALYRVVTQLSGRIREATYWLPTHPPLTSSLIPGLISRAMSSMRVSEFQ